MKTQKNRPADTSLEYHRPHLVTVSPEVVSQKLKFFRLASETMAPLPFICQSFEVKPPYTRYRKWIHPLDPVSLDDLKNWFGVPNEVAKRLMDQRRTVSEGGMLWTRVTNFTPAALPMKKRFEFRSLDQEQRLAVRQASFNLLYGYADPEVVSKPPYSGVVDYMLQSANNSVPAIFAAPDLIVCPDKVVKFEKIAALYFNNILIYGNGQIVTKGHTKIHAAQITHVNA